ncbi:hypothetical protein Rhe02_50800 [Rhizocola hellebori]|uniref:VWFD domain-containing protein n=2 Tax=Rhizocola hellebori TaxID=1392758 RepID=A0A8J3QC87_9ACTN|nr:hypothetical protein Rhe02_50800 [Rhizocola hellebori]
MVTWPQAALAGQAEGGLSLELKSARSAYGANEPARLTLTITNNGGTGCRLAKTAEGTVQVLSVRRDGQDLSPVLSRSFYEDGINSAIASRMTEAKPQSAVEVPLVGLRVQEGTVLRSVTAVPDGTGMDALWPIGEPGRYEVTLSYAAPPVAGACPGVTESKTVSFTVGEAQDQRPWLWIVVAAAVLLLVLGLVVVLLLRRKHRASAAAVLMLVALVAVGGATGRPAFADYEVDPTAGLPVDGVDFKAEVDACFAKFSASGGDPAGIMSRLKDPKTPKVRIIPTTGGSDTFETPLSPAGKGSSTITWNPVNLENYEGDVARDPCSALYHELSHADDISKDSVPKGDCGDTGIKTAEVKATFTENKYRTAKGLPPRKKYDGKDLPKSLEDCKKPKKKTPPAKGPVKLCEGAGKNQCGSTNGDPHLVTFDRAYYDFQAVGEFVVARSTSGDPLEVQARQAPLGSSKTVSINSAVGFRLGTQKIDLSLVQGVTQVRLGGELLVVPPGDKALPGGGKLTRRESDLSSADGYDVQWPDGSAAAVDQIGNYGYRLLLRLAAGRAGKVQGLLGNFDGDPENDIAPLGGSALARPISFDKLYPSYADSWRIKQGESLFTYASGQSTETFTDRQYPQKPLGISDLDVSRRAQAEEICRWAGVTDTWQFLECVFDVAVSGRPEFAVGSLGTERIAPPQAAPISAAPLATATLAAGTGARLTFAGRTGQAVFVDAIAPTMLDRCSPYRLLDPAGKYLNSGCNINGIGHIDRTELPADGEYTVLIDPAVTVGRATLRVYLAKDTNTDIAPNGAAMSVTIEQPGSVARYRFAGVAGQRVFVDVPESSLPDQCSPLQLRDPADRVLASGCVINGSGDIEGTVLPADGSYTVVVDPQVRSIGTAQIRLFAAKDQTSAIALGGQPVIANVTQPGLALRYQFSATAGTSVTLDVTESTLPDQCSPLRLLDPDGKQLRSGCVINGKGDLAKVSLPVTGTYTIIVDPSGAATGTAKLVLHQ